MKLGWIVWKCDTVKMSVIGVMMLMMTIFLVVLSFVIFLVTAKWRSCSRLGIKVSCKYVYVCKHAWVRICVRVYVCVYVHIFAKNHSFISVCIYMSVSVFAFRFVCMCACVMSLMYTYFCRISRYDSPVPHFPIWWMYKYVTGVYRHTRWYLNQESEHVYTWQVCKIDGRTASLFVW